MHKEFLSVAITYWQLPAVTTLLLKSVDCLQGQLLRRVTGKLISKSVRSVYWKRCMGHFPASGQNTAIVRSTAPTTPNAIQVILFITVSFMHRLYRERSWYYLSAKYCRGMNRAEDQAIFAYPAVPGVCRAASGSVADKLPDDLSGCTQGRHDFQARGLPGRG